MLMPAVGFAQSLAGARERFSASKGPAGIDVTGEALRESAGVLVSRGGRGPRALNHIARHPLVVRRGVLFSFKKFYNSPSVLNSVKSTKRHFNIITLKLSINSACMT